MARRFDPGVLRRMPLVQWVIDTHREARPLRGWKVLLIQHQLENHLAQAQALLELGVEPRELFWIDIPYTSSSEIRRAVAACGVPVGNFATHGYTLTRGYATYQRSRVADWIRRFMRRYGENVPLLVLDDGGYFLEALICFRRRPRRLAIVEQTMRGIEKMEQNHAIRHYCRSVPVIDVARSRPKKRLEPPIIAKAVREAAGERVRRILGRGHVRLARSNVLVLGYGAIGKEVAREIQLRFELRPRQVFVHDIDRKRCRDATGAGYSLWNSRDRTKAFGLVIGCTGRRAFNMWNYVHLARRAVLISASSGSAEVAREDFIELADACTGDDIRVHGRSSLARRSIHSDITLHVVGHIVTIANGGFPVNFDGRLDRIPAEDIQITMAMMVRAAVQAVTSRRHGLVPLHRGFCRALANRFQQVRRSA